MYFATYYLYDTEEEGDIATPITLKDKTKELSPAQRKKVEARAAELISEEMTLRELRHARKLTQVKMAKRLGVTQDSVSRLEKASGFSSHRRINFIFSTLSVTYKLS
jgi:DNA-binding XRE family transcriptional regulator